MASRATNISHGFYMLLQWNDHDINKNQAALEKEAITLIQKVRETR